ncbi:hypothetical protein [Wolbachia endosymbiont of Brugia pahangi]|uniref:hypothetical protein n=1 Tax=Wolbachia endosymbiont of Brugia pahangi TaxID=96495 RepID=UPI001435EC16|nr:hypothetical protein [Wolbachia endosymbiont of Brugia pahangi]QIT35770.1 hypothetical protein WBP_0171 [Wolbachia endosymbiont of Brugia pahangi]
MPPKPSIALPVLKKTFATNQKIGQKPRKDRPKILPKSKNLGRADQKEEVNTKPGIK